MIWHITLSLVSKNSIVTPNFTVLKAQRLHFSVLKPRQSLGGYVPHFRAGGKLCTFSSAEQCKSVGAQRRFPSQRLPTGHFCQRRRPGIQRIGYPFGENKFHCSHQRRHLPSRTFLSTGISATILKLHLILKTCNIMNILTNVGRQ